MLQVPRHGSRSRLTSETKDNRLSVPQINAERISHSHYSVDPSPSPFHSNHSNPDVVSIQNLEHRTIDSNQHPKKPQRPQTGQNNLFSIITHTKSPKSSLLPIVTAPLNSKTRVQSPMNFIKSVQMSPYANASQLSYTSTVGNSANSVTVPGEYRKQEEENNSVPTLRENVSGSFPRIDISVTDVNGRVKEVYKSSYEINEESDVDLNMTMEELEFERIKEKALQLSRDLYGYEVELFGGEFGIGFEGPKSKKGNLKGVNLEELYNSKLGYGGYTTRKQWKNIKRRIKEIFYQIL
ncbi:hypothetical protein BKA69DRAFT_1172946 [Paraphysoderma sedebokerense]|nr:hypothetical protein BKA69DRAFT_1172946 [Paraphysoderma sedebokerense]